MKNILILLLALSMLCGCKKDGKTPGVPEEPVVNDTLAVNYYKPSVTTETDVPQFTIKNNKVQFTALGANENGRYKKINQIYISDVDNKTEWVSLLNGLNQPEFFYAVNTDTKEKLPELYWMEHKDGGTVILRYYKYDWTNRLGTLVYEAEVDLNNEVRVLFDNSLNAATPNTTSSLRSSRGAGTAVRSGEKSAFSPKSFPSPVLAFERFSSTDDDTSVDVDINDFMAELKELKEQGIKASCTVSSLLNTPDRGLVCKLADVLDRYVNAQLFNEVARLDEQQRSSDLFDFQGDDTDYSVQSFIDFEGLSNLGERHFNSIRSAIPDIGSFRDWFTSLLATSNATVDDLDDLSDSNGVIQVGLSWDTDQTDIDLHVTDPSGEEIFFSHPNSASGGYLDRDDTDGFGPENIYWINDIPDGTYKVHVVYYGPSTGPTTNYTIKVINGLGVSRNFTGSLGFNLRNAVPVTSFTKRGNQLTFN